MDTQDFAFTNLVLEYYYEIEIINSAPLIIKGQMVDFPQIARTADNFDTLNEYMTVTFQKHISELQKTGKFRLTAPSGVGDREAGGHLSLVFAIGDNNSFRVM